jgi:hypothetical protein
VVRLREGKFGVESGARASEVNGGGENRKRDGMSANFTKRAPRKIEGTWQTKITAIGVQRSLRAVVTQQFLDI